MRWQSARQRLALSHSWTQTLERMPTDVRPYWRHVGSRWCFLAAVGDLNGNPTEDLVSKASDPPKGNRLDQHLEIVSADDDRRPPFVEITPQNAVRLGGLLPGDEGGPMRVARVVVAGGGVNESRKGSVLWRGAHGRHEISSLQLSANQPIGNVSPASAERSQVREQPGAEGRTPPVSRLVPAMAGTQLDTRSSRTLEQVRAFGCS